MVLVTASVKFIKYKAIFTFFLPDFVLFLFNFLVIECNPSYREANCIHMSTRPVPLNDTKPHFFCMKKVYYFFLKLFNACYRISSNVCSWAKSRRRLVWPRGVTRGSVTISSIHHTNWNHCLNRLYDLCKGWSISVYFENCQRFKNLCTKTHCPRQKTGRSFLQ